MTDKDIIGLKFEVKWCDHCENFFVKCARCGNNCCNGGSGEEGKCPICPVAYELQDSLDKILTKENI